MRFWSQLKKLAAVPTAAATAKPKDSPTKDAVKAVQSVKTVEKSKQIDVLFYDEDSNSMEETVGVTSNISKFLLCPYNNGMYMSWKPFWKTGKRTVLVSKDHHHAADMRKLDEWAKKVKAKYDVTLSYGDIVEHMTFDNVQSQIDPGFYDNKWSESFTVESGLVTRSDLLKMILDPPQKTLLYMVAIAGLVCFIAGAGSMGILAVLIGWWS